MLSVDWQNKLVLTTTSILDLPAFKDDVRALEDSSDGVLYPPIITYKRVDLGGGAYMHAVDFINGYRLKFVNPGSYTIQGNLNCEIVTDPGVYVERKTAAAFATTSVGGSVPTLEEFAAAVWGHSSATELATKMTLVSKILRNKTVTDPSTGKITVYDDDNSTVLLQANLFENVAGTQAYRGEGAERRDRLV